ncbi:MAG: glycosyltransferase [Planctomycetota bacterium]
MKVLHVYAGNLYGGIEAVLVSIARAADATPSCLNEFGLCFEGRLADELKGAGAVVHKMGAVRFSKPWTLMRARRRLSALLRNRAYDAVVTHANWPHAVFARVVKRVGTARLVNWVHDVIQPTGWINRHAALTPPDLIVANSKFTAEFVPKVFPGRPIRVVHCPVPLPNASRDATLRSSLGADDNTVVFISASRLEPWKGHQQLIEALERLPRALDWVAWIAGGAQRVAEQQYLANLKRRVEELGLADRVRFLGQRTDVPALLASADVFCQPNSGPEPFGVIFVEALYAGLPVVSSGFGGASEIVTPDCGVLVPPGDVEQLASALRRLASDAELRVRLASAGPARAAALCDPSQQIRALHSAIAEAAA